VASSARCAAAVVTPRRAAISRTNYPTGVSLCPRRWRVVAGGPRIHLRARETGDGLRHASWPRPYVPIIQRHRYYFRRRAVAGARQARTALWCRRSGGLRRVTRKLIPVPLPPLARPTTTALQPPRLRHSAKLRNTHPVGGSELRIISLYQSLIVNQHCVTELYNCRVARYMNKTIWNVTMGNNREIGNYVDDESSAVMRILLSRYYNAHV